MLDASYFCHVCKSVCFCLNQKLVVSLVPRVLTPVIHVSPPLDTPTSGYKFSSVGNYDQSSKVSLQVRLKTRWPLPWWDASQPDAWCSDERPPYHGKDAWGTNSCHATMENQMPEETMEGKLPVNSDEPLMSCQPIRRGALEALDGPRWALEALDEA